MQSRGRTSGPNTPTLPHNPGGIGHPRQTFEHPDPTILPYAVNDRAGSHAEGREGVPPAIPKNPPTLLGVGVRRMSRGVL
jgi:hypothetical protein